MTFFGESRASEEVQHHIHESPKVMTRAARAPGRSRRRCSACSSGWPPEAGWIHTLPRARVLRRRAREVRLARRRRRCSCSSRWPSSLAGIYLAYVMYIAPPRAARAAGGAAAVGLPGLAQQVLHGRVLRGGADPAHRELRRLAVDVLRRRRSSTAPSTASPGCWARLARLFGRCRRAALQNYALGIFAGMLVLVVVVRWLWRAGEMGWQRADRLPDPLGHHLPAAAGGRSSCCWSARAGRPSTRSIALVATLVAFVLSVVMLLRVPPRPAGHAVRRGLRPGSTASTSTTASAIDGIAALLLFLTTLLGVIVIIAQLELRQGPRARLLHLAAAAADRHDRRLLRHRHLPLLRVLGGHAGADVLHHRYLGRPAEDLRGHQVLPLHAGRQPAHAGRHHRRRVLRQERAPAALTFNIQELEQPGATRTACSSGRSSPSSWRSPSRCRCSRCTPGCPTPTSRRRPPAR